MNMITYKIIFGSYATLVSFCAGEGFLCK